ncbi:MAG: hypothetical protein ACFCUM_12115 [Bacteroidales bacterium]
MKTNTKKNFLKLAMTLMATFIFSGAMAQVSNGDYQQYSATLQGPSEIDYVTLRTGGSTVMGYFASPDPVYHGNYNSGGGWALTADFVWNWTVSGGMVTNKPGVANYVEVTFTAADDYNITVAEQASAVFGGCADATPTEMVVRVIAPPTATITTADKTDFCGLQAAQPINIRIVENIPDALATYAFAVVETVDRIDENDAVLANVRTVPNYVDFTMAVKGVATDALGGWTAASPNFDYDFNSAALDIESGNRTRYTYTLVKATDAPAAAGNGIISAITEKSDYVAAAGGADYLTYPFTNASVVFVVNPAPSTGPIFHIPNDFSL